MHKGVWDWTRLGAETTRAEAAVTRRWRTVSDSIHVMPLLPGEDDDGGDNMMIMMRMMMVHDDRKSSC